MNTPRNIIARPASITKRAIMRRPRITLGLHSVITGGCRAPEPCREATCENALLREGGGNDVFVHISAVERAGLEEFSMRSRRSNFPPARFPLSGSERTDLAGVVGGVFTLGLLAALGEQRVRSAPTCIDNSMVHNDPFGSPLFLDPQCYPHCIAAAVQTGFFLATRQLSAIITFRSIAFGPPNERDRQGQVGRVPKPLPASRRAKRILVPAAVAAAENVRGGLAQARPSGFFDPCERPSRNGITAQCVRSVMASSVSTPAAGFHVEQKRV